MPKSPQLVLQKYQQRVQNSGPAYKEGVQNPRRSWSGEWTKAQPKMLENLRRAVEEGRAQAAVQRTGDSGWQTKTMQKSDRYASSAQIAAEGYAAVVDKVMSAATAGQNAANQHSPNTWEGRVQRMRSNAEAIAAHWGKPLV